MNKYTKEQKWKLVRISTPVVLVLASAVFFVWFCGNKEPNTANSLLIYYTATIVGSFATLLAVCIALFGDKIKNFIYSYDVKVSVKSNQFIEQLDDEDAPTPIAKCYDGILIVENSGSKIIKDCELSVTDISFQPDGKKKSKKLNYVDYNLKWNDNETKKDFRVIEKHELVLSRIYPKEDSSQPTPAPDTKVVPAHLDIEGAKLDASKSSKGVWTISCQLSCAQEIIKTFKVEIEWSGVWKNRAQEMNTEASIKLL